MPERTGIADVDPLCAFNELHPFLRIDAAEVVVEIDIYQRCQNDLQQSDDCGRPFHCRFSILRNK